MLNVYYAGMRIVLFEGTMKEKMKLYKEYIRIFQPDVYAVIEYIENFFRNR